MYGVVTPQGMFLGQLAGAVRNEVGDTQTIVGQPIFIKIGNRSPMLHLGKDPLSPLTGEACACLRVGNGRRGDSLGLLDGLAHQFHS